MIGRKWAAAAGMLLAGWVALCAPAAALDLSTARPVLTFSLASKHVGATRDYNESNLGVGLGIEIDHRTAPVRFGIEAGRYRNSHDETSVYVMGSVSRKVATFGDGRTELNLGLMAGTAKYPGRGDGFRAKGCPTVGDWVLAAGATVGLRQDDRVEARLGVFPASGIADMIVTLQVRLILGD